MKRFLFLVIILLLVSPASALWSNGTIDANRLLLRNPTSVPAGTSFTDLRNGTGTAIFETLTSIRAGGTYANTTLTTGTYADYHYRTEVSIASPVPAGNTVDSASFGMYFNSSDISMGSPYTCLLDSTTTGTAWGAGDYQNTTFLKYSDACKIGDAVNDKVTWDLNAAAIANISDQRFTMMLDDNKMWGGNVINYSWVAGGSSKVWWQTGDVFPALAPFYNISYHVADTPPGSGIPNPTSHWAFDEGSGTNADDPFGARDGTITGATWDTNGYSDDCLSFDGGDYVTMTNTSSYNFAGDYTVSIWVNSSQEQGNSVDILSNGEVLLRHTTAPTTSYGDLYFLQNVAGAGPDGVYTGYASSVTEYELPEYKWTNILMVMSSNTMKVYINGVKDRDYPLGLDVTSTTDRSVSGYTREGLTTLTVGSGFVGKLDEVKIWNIALTEDQIKSAYDHKPTILEKNWKTTIGKPLSNIHTIDNNQTVHEGQRLMFEVIAKDIYWTNYTFSMTSGPTGATFTESPYYYAPYYKGQVGVFCWTPSYGQTGTYTPCLYVTNATSGVSDHVCVGIEVKKNYMLDPSSCASGYIIQGDGDCVPTLKTNYGHEANPSSNPVGGGVGYGQIYTSGDYRVGDLNQLLWALSHATSGEVIYVLPNSTIDVTKQHQRSVPAGVTIASDRGHAGSLGALIYMNYNSTSINHAEYRIFQTGGNNVRFTGLRLQGPDTSMRYEQVRFFDHYATGYTPWLPNNIIIYQRDSDSGLTVDNCEIDGWGEAAIDPEEKLTTGYLNVNVSYNYAHHQQRQGGGYVVWAHRGTITTFEGNVLNYGRHYISGSRGNVANPPDYWANYNIIGDRINGFALDNHGGNDVPDSSPAGRNMTVYNNTIYAMGGDYAAHGVRGVPLGWSFDKYNWARAVVTSDNSSAHLFTEEVDELGAPFVSGNYYNMTVSNNYINLTRPTSIGALTADTATGGQITFSFVTPSGSATNDTLIYKDGVLQYRVSNTTTSVIFSGLSAGDYTISTRTCDTTGDCASSPWYNLTATATDAGAGSNLLIILHYLWQFFHIGAWLK